jgi:hypothetical protein
MTFVDEVRRRAGQARFETERVLRINRIRAHISVLQEQLDGDLSQLGHVTYELAGKGEIEHPQLRQICEQLDGVRAQVATAEAEIKSIQAETYEYVGSTVRCPACGADNDDEARFCHRCGSPLAAPQPVYAPQPTVSGGAACGNCGAANPPGMRFCQQCGTPLPSGAPAPAPVAAVQAPPGQPAAQPEPVPAAASLPAAIAADVPTAEARAGAAPVTSGSPLPDIVAAPAVATPPPDSATTGTAVPAEGEATADAAPAATTFCPACGMELDATALFCSRCGRQLSAA